MCTRNIFNWKVELGKETERKKKQIRIGTMFDESIILKLKAEQNRREKSFAILFFFLFQIVMIPELIELIE